MTYKFADKAELACGSVIVTELTPPKETDIKTATLLQIYKFASSIEPYLLTRNSNIPEYLQDECWEIISQLNELIVARTKGD